jgi:hypothetical protein
VTLQAWGWIAFVVLACGAAGLYTLYTLRGLKREQAAMDARLRELAEQRRRTMRGERR